MTEIDMHTLKAELARRDLPQWRLAQQLGVAASTVSEWLRGAKRAPEDLRERIERVLGLPEGALKPQAPTSRTC